MRILNLEQFDRIFSGNAHIILLAGYETTANALTYTLWLLAKHPDIQERLRQDVSEAGVNSQYLDMVWMESLRLMPPVTGFVTRQAVEDVDLNGYKITKGCTVQAPVWRVHHDPDVWPDPYKFDPERFSAENRRHIHPAAFLTFGLGPRYCLGAQLAHFEGKLLIARVLGSYRLELADKSQETLKLKCPTVIINPDGPVNLRFTALD